MGLARVPEYLLFRMYLETLYLLALNSDKLLNLSGPRVNFYSELVGGNDSFLNPFKDDHTTKPHFPPAWKGGK